MEKYLPWAILLVHVTVLLLVDFFVLHKKDQVVSPKKAIGETLFFVANALAFTGVVFWAYEHHLVTNINSLSADQSIVKYLTGYLIELSLSVDNLFVMAIIFAAYKIPEKYQHRLLFMGILGAIIFRAILIGLGLVLIHKIHSITIFFGIFLLFTAFKMLKKEEEGEDVVEEEVPTTQKGIAKYFKISNKIDGHKLRTKVDGKVMFTAFFGALITIEFTDLLFALDSIPAIFAVTSDPFLVFSSNIFAIMGLRSLYFLLSNMLAKFAYLKYSVFSILIFVSVKLMTANWVKIPEWFSLSLIASSLFIGVWISIMKLRRDEYNSEKSRSRELRS